MHDPCCEWLDGWKAVGIVGKARQLKDIETMAMQYALSKRCNLFEQTKLLKSAAQTLKAVLSAKHIFSSKCINHPLTK